MSRKNHKIVNGRLLQTDKPFSQLKQSQKEKIHEWLYLEYSKIYQANGISPDSRHNETILCAVYEKIEESQIWIPFGEVQKYFYRHKNKFRKRFEKMALKDN